MDKLHLKPASKDVIVRDPTTGKPLADKGEKKPRTSYWIRRLRDGDVIDLDARPEPKTEKPKGGNAS